MKIQEMLGVWSEWMRRDNVRLSYPEKSVALQGGGSWGSAFDEWEMELNGKIAESLNALIDGDKKYAGILTISERLAVHNVHLSAVWKSNRTNIEDDYTRALFKLSAAMKRRDFLVEE